MENSTSLLHYSTASELRFLGTVKKLHTQTFLKIMNSTSFYPGWNNDLLLERFVRKPCCYR